MAGLCEGRVAIVTGAGRGIGREYALMLASEGAKVVVNDLGGARDGTGSDEVSPAQQVVDEISAMGAHAVVNGEDVSDWDGAKRMIDQAIDTFGGLDVVVNNAGILRDRMLTNMSEDEWDAVIKVHLKGTFAPSRHAAAYWRERVKAGEENDARLINTTSVSGIYGALTRMTEDLGMGNADDEAKEMMNPRWVAPIVTWLASAESSQVTGRVFQASGRGLGIANSWHQGPMVDALDDPNQLGPVVRQLMADAQPNSDMRGQPHTGPGYPTPY